MKIEVKKRVFELTDANRVAFAYGVIQTPHSEEIIECENGVPQIGWEHAYAMTIMKIKMRFPNSVVEHHQNLLSDGTWRDVYSVTEYIVSA